MASTSVKYYSFVLLFQRFSDRLVMGISYNIRGWSFSVFIWKVSYFVCLTSFRDNNSIKNNYNYNNFDNHNSCDNLNLKKLNPRLKYRFNTTSAPGLLVKYILFGRNVLFCSLLAKLSTIIYPQSLDTEQGDPRDSHRRYYHFFDFVLICLIP